MEFLNSVFIFFAGLWAGTINSVVGSGTLATFPVLIALGYAPVPASISNAMGLVAGNAAGAWGYRKELTGRGRQLLRLLPAGTPSGVRSLVRPCLEKDPKRRLRDIADARLAIDDAVNQPADGGSGSHTRDAGARRAGDADAAHPQRRSHRSDGA